jgi:hypothetical protein
VILIGSVITMLAATAIDAWDGDVNDCSGFIRPDCCQPECCRGGE